jgi:hypothetical protein
MLFRRVLFVGAAHFSVARSAAKKPAYRILGDYLALDIGEWTFIRTFSMDDFAVAEIPLVNWLANKRDERDRRILHSRSELEGSSERDSIGTNGSRLELQAPPPARVVDTQERNQED